MRRTPLLLPPLLLFSACSNSTSGGPPPAADCAGPCPATNIKHLVVIVQENHTFDCHFGRYCTAPTGSNPTCNTGPACCEAAPDKDPAGTTPLVLDDKAMAAFDPNHSAACEDAERNGGKMDKFATAPKVLDQVCGDPQNVAYADPSIIKPYWDYASEGALADRYFQPISGASSSNDMYFARAGWVFTDNEYQPEGAVGTDCSLSAGRVKLFTEQTIADLLIAANVPFTFYAEGYGKQADSRAKTPKECATAEPDCPIAPARIYPCVFDPGDVPFAYYASTRDNPKTMKDFSAFDTDLGMGTLPAVSFLKAFGFRSEHPGYGIKLSDGVKWVAGVVSRIKASRYAPSTLILVTYDEGGGYFDHITPPPASAVDNKPYGTRVPMLALGPFARKNYVSHVTMEHSSVVKFIEYNWLGKKAGQLNTRDATVANLGSLLDPALGVPDN